MALIPCKYCGKSVSEKAKVCPNCGGLLMDSEVEEHSVKYCKECGAELLEGSDTCPNCGCPVENCDLSGEGKSAQKFIKTEKGNVTKYRYWCGGCDFDYHYCGHSVR